MSTDNPTPQATARYRLWSHLHTEHKLTLLESEVDEIIDLAIAANTEAADYLKGLVQCEPQLEDDELRTQVQAAAATFDQSKIENPKSKIP